MQTPPEASSPAVPSPTRGRGWPRLLTVLLLPVTAVGLWLEGQRWWCAEGDAALWISDIWSAHNSQHLGDPYSLSHFNHGLILALLFMLPRLRNVPAGWQWFTGAAVEAAWELIENTDFVINRYRDVTLALGYTGDTIANSLFDVLFYVAGFAVARALGWKASLAIIVAIELVMLAWIRDNLTLNTLMLLCPVDAIKAWQMGGQ